MPALFRPVRAYPIPADAKITTHKGRPAVCVLVKGKSTYYPLTKDGKKMLKPAAKWCADVRHADGSVKRIRFSENKEVAQRMLSDRLKEIELERAGIRNPYSEHRSRLLSEMLLAYRQHQLDKGNTDKQADQVIARCQRVFVGCRFMTLSDLSCEHAGRWLAEQRRTKIGPRRTIIMSLR